MKSSIAALLVLSTSILTSGMPVAEPTFGHAKSKASQLEDVWEHSKSPFKFTSVFKVVATPDQVVNGTTPVPGQEGAVGYFNFGFNSEQDVVCYNITLYGVTGAYQSPAITATHIHSAAKGASGSPRIAFPNPVPVDGNLDGCAARVSIGCLSAPFVTGLNSSGIDTGSASGFTIKQLEDNPSAYMADVHTTMFSLGAVRGQLA
ncbi:hypothetical protein UCRPC4_g01387 [Phaeomoniella chlamydospora]|uniref:CHRD domain-containing protein n=1 Tax=Phaeomoniella chlamydospora TaxID=158046 RepID=A0A0G2EXY4_PHACM|nr:hypothetical protein UCRPC4_g01387 [Phaeomoniella chlamydospora]